MNTNLARSQFWKQWLSHFTWVGLVSYMAKTHATVTTIAVRDGKSAPKYFCSMTFQGEYITVGREWLKDNLTESQFAEYAAGRLQKC
jgi:hypothetical protein